MTIVISEETGKISVAKAENIQKVTLKELEENYLAPLFDIKPEIENNKQ
jgi:hypothetical protein